MKTGKIYFRGIIIFFIIYIFMMAVITYVTANNLNMKMYNLYAAAMNELKQTMDYSLNTLNQEKKELDNYDINYLYENINRIRDSLINDNIYIRSEIYDGLGNILAKSGNVLLVEDFQTGSDGTVSKAVDINMCILLDDIMTIDEMNDFFGNDNMQKYISMKVKGFVNDGNIIPTKFELFDHISCDNVIAEKEFTLHDTLSSETERVFGAVTFLCETFFEKSSITGNKITAKDVTRFNLCTQIAKTQLDVWQNEQNRDDPKVYSDNIFSVKKSRLIHNGLGHGKYDRYLSCGIVYYPLETAINQLIPVYILSFIFIAVCTSILLKTFATVYNKQLRLEKSRRNLTNAISHELKTPISIIKNYSEALKENIGSSKKDYYIDVIINETDAMDKMVIDMLNLSKLENGAYVLNKQDFSLKRLTKKVIERFETLILDKDINLSFECDNDFIINADSVAIEHVISNYLKNAIEHSPVSGQVEILISDESGKTFFSIENEGEPIPDDVLTHIWDGFYRSSDSKTGLGLIIVKNYLDIHKANYECKNTETGVKFCFMI